MSISIVKDGDVTIVAINRPEARNAVDPETATALYDAFRAFEADPSARAAILTGSDTAFCAGFDLKRAASSIDESWFVDHAIETPADMADDRAGPMGPTRLRLSKPVIAAVEGPAVAGGMELALWCDLRVMASDAFMGVYCRRWGVPLIDGGAIRLPRIVGQGRALDLILTGRKVEAEEAARIGLADRIAPPGEAMATALTLAHDIARFPQACMRADRSVAHDQWSLPFDAAFAREWRSAATFREEGVSGAARFSGGKGRSGAFDDI
ncbi:MAG: crotonase/enoyl-CoA hydratase family protein [Pseudomonadota bacterium]